MIRKPTPLVLLVMVIAAAAVAGLAVPLTSHPRFCATCHTIKPSYDNWLTSSHKEVTCVACHVRPGLHGFLQDKVVTGLKDVAITWFGTPPEPYNLDAKVYSEVCLSCHRAVLRVSEIAERDLPPPVKNVGLIMSHRQHMDAFAKRMQGEGCTTCHSRVVHGRPIKGYPIVIPRGHVDEDPKPYAPDFPEDSHLYKATMADCFRCHDSKTTHEGTVLSNRCETCHIPGKISDMLF